MTTTGLPDWPWTRAKAEDLPPAEALLLDAVRAWHGGAAPAHAAALILAAEDAAAAAIPLNSMLRFAPVTVHRPLCPCIGTQEAALLLACALAQRGARSEALAAFLRLLPLHLAYAAMPPAIRLGVAFRRAGLFLQNPLRQAFRQAPAARG